MPVDGVNSLANLQQLQPLQPMRPLETQPAASHDNTVAGGFSSVLNHLLAESRQSNDAATKAIEDLATGKAQDLHTVTVAVAQADVSFRMILELRNRLSDALQEITRMQV
jgi:flagellar hook-basal body complex protein FliE